jgi:hypothetical protein
MMRSPIRAAPCHRIVTLRPGSVRPLIVIGLS